jgi:hypothetical protein
MRLWLERLSRLALGLAALAACQPSPRLAYDDPDLLFKDDFSATTGGWDSYSDSEKTTDYDAGRYLIGVEQTGVVVWAQPQLDFANLTLSVETQYAAGPDNNEYGVMCRYSREGDKHSFYFFFISSDGYYAMGKVIKNKRTILNPADGNYQPSDAINLDKSAANRLSATCNGQRLSFAVNGAPVGEFEDGDLSHGDIGLVVGTFDEGGVHIHFDDLEVRKP